MRDLYALVRSLMKCSYCGRPSTEDCGCLAAKIESAYPGVTKLGAETEATCPADHSQGACIRCANREALGSRLEEV
jgi:hypothetical protein